MAWTIGVVSAQHYENFPVASVLCPPRLRPAVAAIYHFARTGDDLADEGEVDVAGRLRALGAYREALHRCGEDDVHGAAWSEVFSPLAQAIQQHALPRSLLDDLLDAFIQDVHNPVYANRAELLDYCRRSANPVGRLLLHLYGVGDAASLQASDAICTALQLINFWQDLSVDLPRGRCYVPREDAERHGLDLGRLAVDRDGPPAKALVRELVAWARALMFDGAPLAQRLPGRAGWELRLVVQGGLRILEKIERMDFAAFDHRPVIGGIDAPVLAWRALTWRAPCR